MNMNKFGAAKTFLLGLALASSAAHAAHSKGQTAITGTAGLAIPVAPEFFTDNTDMGFGLGAKVQHYLSEKWALGVGYDYLNFDDTSLTDHTINALAHYNFMTHKKFTPFIEFGGGITKVNNYYETQDPDYWQWSAKGALGMEFHLHKNIALSPVVNYFYIHDNDKPNAAKQHIIMPALELTFFFGGNDAYASTNTNTQERTVAATAPADPQYRANVYFPLDSDKVIDAQAATLDHLANRMKRDPKATLVVEGHTDATGTAEYNRELSKRRAESVKEYLTSEHNIDAKRIRVVGYGEYKPKASNETESGRAQNRRANTQL